MCLDRCSDIGRDYWRGWVPNSVALRKGGRERGNRGEGPGPAGALLKESTRKGRGECRTLITLPIPPPYHATPSPFPACAVRQRQLICAASRGHRSVESGHGGSSVEAVRCPHRTPTKDPKQSLGPTRIGEAFDTCFSVDLCVISQSFITCIV